MNLKPFVELSISEKTKQTILKNIKNSWEDTIAESKHNSAGKRKIKSSEFKNDKHLIYSAYYDITNGSTTHCPFVVFETDQQETAVLVGITNIYNLNTNIYSEDKMNLYYMLGRVFLPTPALTKNEQLLRIWKRYMAKLLTNRTGVEYIESEIEIDTKIFTTDNSASILCQQKEIIQVSAPALTQTWGWGDFFAGKAAVLIPQYSEDEIIKKAGISLYYFSMNGVVLPLLDAFQAFEHFYKTSTIFETFLAGCAYVSTFDLIIKKTVLIDKRKGHLSS